MWKCPLHEHITQGCEWCVLWSVEVLRVIREHIDLADEVLGPNITPIRGDIAI